MKLILSLPAGLVLSLLLAFAPEAQAHTWVEQLSVVSLNGTFVGAPGYIRGASLPRNATFDDTDVLHLLPPNGRTTGNAILPTDLMCKSSQTVPNQRPGSPALNAAPRDLVALRYLENGHVTKPSTPPGKPEGSGVVYIYGTSKSASSDTYLGIHHVWNEAGTGGDGRGVLLATRHFDDGRCYEDNPSDISIARRAQFPHSSQSIMRSDIWCQTDVQLPGSITGLYTLYWVWEWPTLDVSGKVITNESYTSCIDINITPATGTSSGSQAFSYIQGQDLNYAAIPDQLTDSFLVKPNFTNPVYVPASNGPSSAPTQARPTSQSSSQAPTGFITVTVTAPPAQETATVTVSPRSNTR